MSPNDGKTNAVVTSGAWSLKHRKQLSHIQVPHQSTVQWHRNGKIKKESSMTTREPYGFRSDIPALSVYIGYRSFIRTAVEAKVVVRSTLSYICTLKDSSDVSSRGIRTITW